MNKSRLLRGAGIALLGGVLTGSAVKISHAKDALSELAGKYAAKSIGFLTVCSNGCSNSSPILIQLNTASVAQGVADLKGNFCATAEAASSATTGSSSPATVTTKEVTGSVVSYDSVTRQAEVEFSIYSGGQCSGAVFDSTGATLKATGTSHEVFSESGKLIDSIVTSYQSVSGDIAGVVDTERLTRQ